MSTIHRPGALSRNAMAYVLAGGRGSRLLRAHRPPRQARGLFRRQGPDHRLRAVQCHQLGHPPHRGRDPVQGAQPDPPPAARLELPAAGAQRELRHPAGQPARVGDAVVRGHRRRGLSRTSTSSKSYGPEYMVILAGDHVYKMDYERDAAAARRFRRRRHHRLPRGAAHGGHRLRRHACRCAGPGHLLPGEAQGPARHPGQSRHGAGQHGHLRLQHRAAVRPAAPRCRRPELGPRFRQQHHPLPGEEREGRGAPLRPVLRQVGRRGRGLLARCRHGRCLLGGQYRPHQLRPGARPL